MNYLNEMIRRNTRDMLRRNWGKAVALTVTVMAVLLLGSMLESAIGGLTGTYGLGTLLTIYRSSLSALTPARLAASTALTLSVGLVELLLLCPLLLGISEWLTGLSYGICENDMGSVFRHYRSPRLLIYTLTAPSPVRWGLFFCSFHGFLCSSPPSAVFRLPDPRCPAAFSRLPVRCLSPLYPSDFTLFCMALPLPQNIPTMHDPENPLRRKKSAVLHVSWNRGFSILFQTLYGEDEAVHQTGYLLCSL